MSHEAVIFDLDDTLYPERRYALSGFAAVSREVSARYGIDPRDAFRALARALRDGRRHQGFQELCERYALDYAEVPRLVHVLRMHRPRLRLPRATADVLATVRRAQPTAVVTNGLPTVQVRKVAALGLEALVDCVVYASEHGTGLGKPDPAPFLAVCVRLGVHPRECVFVGNDPSTDIAGARAVGMKTIRIGRGEPPLAHADADLVLRHLSGVPAALGVLASLKGIADAA